MNIVFIGLSLSSSWGNGHATTYRSLIKGLGSLGHEVLFLEREARWYAENRDLPAPDYCRLELYASLPDLLGRFGDTLQEADAVIVGSYVPDGVALIDAVYRLQPKRLCFYDIDTPVTLAALRHGAAVYLAARQIPLFDIYFSFTGGPTLDVLEQGFGAQRALPLYCAVDETLYRRTGEAPEWDLGYLGTYSEDRQPALERLLIAPARRLPEARFVVAGPQYPASIDWPDNVTRIDHLPPAEHASFYSRQRFTLNITRADMIAAGWAPSVRLFEAAACGTPVISDEWPGLREIFGSGTGLSIVRSGDEVVRLLQGHRADGLTADTQAIRRTVLIAHTGRVRAAELAAHLQAVPFRHGRVAAE